MSDPHDTTEPALERFVFFSDAVFAIAITLIALEIKAPNLPGDAGEAAWEAALLALAPSFFSFVLSFYVIGNIWSAHHAVFRLVGRFDQRLMAPNLLLLMAVVLVPFSSALLGRTVHASAPYALYSATLVFAGVAKGWLTTVALKPDLLRPGVPPKVVTVYLRRTWLLPASAAVAVALAFVAPAWNNLAMLLLLAGRLPMFRARF